MVRIKRCAEAGAPQSHQMRKAIQIGEVRMTMMPKLTRYIPPARSAYLRCAALFSRRANA
jgi:hypothetical protein